MAAKKPQDISCMFCGETPCSCALLSKKPAPRKAATKSEAPKVEPAPTVRQEAPPVKREIPAPDKRAGLSVLATTVQVARNDDSASEREALTALVKAGFMLTPADEPDNFNAIRPKLNMSPVEIDIAIWKARRLSWLHRQPVENKK